MCVFFCFCVSLHSILAPERWKERGRTNVFFLLHLNQTGDYSFSSWCFHSDKTQSIIEVAVLASQFYRSYLIATRLSSYKRLWSFSFALASIKFLLPKWTFNRQSKLNIYHANGKCCRWRKLFSSENRNPFWEQSTEGIFLCKFIDRRCYRILKNVKYQKNIFYPFDLSVWLKLQPVRISLKCFYQ